MLVAIRTMKNITSNKKELSPKEREELLRALKDRFEKNLNRHKGLDWAKVRARLEANAEKLWSLNEMERTGGEPDVVGQDKKSGEYVFNDCSAESPKGRVSFATTARRWIRGRNINPKTASWIKGCRAGFRACPTIFATSLLQRSGPASSCATKTLSLT
jgi:hypothetical protein